MCIVSVITQYGMQYPPQHWNEQNWQPFKALLDQARIVDVRIGEPDCIDPEKKAWIERIDRQIAELEELKKEIRK
jgi:hypothetical protein